MTQRALLIGSQTHGLEGVEADVGRMGEALARQGFTTITPCTGKAADREGILGAYARLIDETQWLDAVCLYYSGHGGRLDNRFAVGPRVLQYLVPTDHQQGSFRGVMSFELSALLAKLTAKTPNVTVIFDCCHAGQMTRGGRAGAPGPSKLRAKAWTDDVSAALVEELLARAREGAVPLDPESNPLAVRLLATEPHEFAFEEKAEGYVGGVFTRALLAVLAQRGQRKSSSGSLMQQVRELVMQRTTGQRPDVEGPGRRLLFELEQVRDERPLPLFFEDGAACVRGGVLLGAAPGARFGVMPAGSDQYSAARALGEAKVIESLGTISRVELQLAGQRPLPEGPLLAFPLGPPVRAKCRVGLGEELSPELGGAIADSPYVAPEPIRPGVSLPTVRLMSGRLVLYDADGTPLSTVAPNELEQLLLRLECLARAQDLLAFAPGSLDTVLDIDISVEIGRIVNGQPTRLGPGEAMQVGARQYVRVENSGIDDYFVAVLGIDAKHSVRLYSRRAPRGFRLRSGKVLNLGEGPNGTVPGFKVSWPDELPRVAPRRESLVVIATDDEHDFSRLTTDDAYQLELVPPPGEPQQTARGLQRGGARRVRAAGSEYRLWTFDYLVDPRPLG